MILSAQQLLSDQQAVTATVVGTNVIDTGVRGTPYDAAAALVGDIGLGNKIPFLAQVTEDFNTLTSLTIAIETGATTGLGTVIQSQTIVVANLVAGKQFALDCVPNDVSERYLGIRYTVTGTAPTLGKITAGISMGNQTNVHGV